MKQTIIIKVGTSTLLSEDERPSNTFKIVADSINSLGTDVRVVLVTSGAIGFGVRLIGLIERPTATNDLQALSMIGQPGLMQSWRQAFKDRPIGQVLVTARELQDSESWTNLQQTITSTWKYNALPIVNENDAISSEEITFGDNDRLAAQLAVKMQASALVFLTDHDGIQADFGKPSQSRLPKLILNEADRYVDTKASLHGTGGIASKLIGAEIALTSGIKTYVGLATQSGAIELCLAGQTGTEIVQ